MSELAEQDNNQVLAAVDLGSNSFHMIVARYEYGQLTVIDRLREMVRLAAGMDDKNRIAAAAAERAHACLERFGQRLRDMHASTVRAVGTNALRKAKNSANFLDIAEAALGHPIEVISGREEARLVYLGAGHSLPEIDGRRLVVDIGGGSTELIVGRGLETEELFSLYMGCVSMTEEFFRGGKITAKRWQRARLAAAVEVEPVRAALRRLGWAEAAGSSGTIRTTRDILRNQQWVDEGITPEALARLAEVMLAGGTVQALNLEGLSAERAPVFPGGVVVLQTVMEELGIDRMRVAQGALREGLLYDMLGRLSDEDARDRSVRALQSLYHTDVDQATRVEETAVDFLGQVRDGWKLNDPLAEKLLRWAAGVYEIGLQIAHSQYHKHGAYLLEHSDIAGFSNRERLLLGRLVLAHRRRIRASYFDDLPLPWRKGLPPLAVLLRLAVLLHRGRGPAPAPVPRLVATKRNLTLCFEPGALSDHALTRTDLELERRYLDAIGFRLGWEENPG